MLIKLGQLGKFVTGTISITAAYEEQAITIFNAMSPDTPTLVQKNAINTAVLRLMNEGIWDSLDALYVLDSNTQKQALVNWVNPGTNDLVAVNSPTFTAKSGINGNGSTSYLRGPNLSTLSNYSQDDGFILVWIDNDPNNSLDSTRPAFGLENAAGNVYCYPRGYNGTLLFKLDQSTESESSGTDIDTMGIISVERTTNSEVTLYKSGLFTQVFNTSTSAAVPNDNIVFGKDYDHYSNMTFGFIAIGSSIGGINQAILTDTLMDYYVTLASPITEHAESTLGPIGQSATSPYSGDGNTYYFSATGSDSNNGTTAATPWLSLSKTSEIGASKTILLKAGDTFRGQLAASAASQIVSSYGTGADPVITGLEDLGTSGWSLSAGGGGGGPTTYLSDTFDRANGSLGTADGGSDGTKTWVAITTASQITSNTINLNGTWGQGRTRNSTTHSLSTSPVEVSFEIVQSAPWDYALNGPALHSNSDPANNLYQFVYIRNSSTAYLQKISSGSTVWSESTTFGTNENNVKIKIRAELSGSDVIVKGKVWLAGDSEPDTWTLSHTDTSGTFTTLYGGFFIGTDDTATNTKFDNFLMTDGASVSSYSYVYEKTVANDPGIYVYEDTSIMTQESNTDDVESNAGSFFYDSGTLYVHASDDGDPTSNGSTYEASQQTNVIDLGAYSGCTVDSVSIKNATGYAVAGTGTYQSISDSVISDSTNGVRLAGLGSTCTSVTITGVDGIIEDIAANGYTSTYNNKTSSSNAAVHTKVETSVTDIPNINYNTYTLSGSTKHGIHQVLGYFGSADPWWNERLRIADEMGTKVLRDIVVPYIFNGSGSGTYSWSRYDSLYPLYAEHPRLNIIYNYVNASPSWMNGSTHSDVKYVPGGGDEAATAFTNWLTAQTTAFTAWFTRYSSYVDYLEIGNEINEQYFWSTTDGGYTATSDADQQRAWFNALAAAAKAIKPTVQIAYGGVVGLGASGGAYGSGTLFIEHSLDDGGGLSNYDAISIHPYDTDAPDNDVAFEYNFTDIASVRSLLVSRGLSAKNIWCTEWGWYGLSDGSTKSTYTATAFDMMRANYPYIQFTTYFQDTDTSDYTTGGLYDSSYQPHSLAEVMAKKINPILHWKGTDYSLPKWQRTTGLDASSINS